MFPFISTVLSLMFDFPIASVTIITITELLILPQPKFAISLQFLGKEWIFRARTHYASRACNVRRKIGVTNTPQASGDPSASRARHELKILGKNGPHWWVLKEVQIRTANRYLCVRHKNHSERIGPNCSRGGRSVLVQTRRTPIEC